LLRELSSNSIQYLQFNLFNILKKKYQFNILFLKKLEALVSKGISFNVENLRQKEIRFDVLLASLAGKFRRIISYKLSADTDEYSLALSLVFSLHESDTIFYLVVLIARLSSNILHESKNTRYILHAHVYSKRYFFFNSF